ncbi:Methylated-DNA--protein-cysteine methyltransferase [uncultured bacterium]|nr:Methylated-DNA--protein-cysteine methyltransferase [uncultured bacterium]
MAEQELLYHYQVAVKGLTVDFITSEKGVRAIFINEDLITSAFLPGKKGKDFGLGTQIKEYLSGKRTQFDVPFDIGGTPFQKSVWKKIAAIPYGKTASYQSIALKLKNEKAVRAVGTAVGTNPLPLVIPCHRVINKSGKLGGFSAAGGGEAGITIKQELLSLEQGTGKKK